MELRQGLGWHRIGKALWSRHCATVRQLAVLV